MAEESAEPPSFEYTPTWVVAVFCSVIVLLSLLAERGLHKLGLFFKRKDQEALFEALQKLKEELMLLGFISLLLTVSQGLTKYMCIPHHLSTIMLPCKKRRSEEEEETPAQHATTMMRRLLTTHDQSIQNCARKIRQWRKWEHSIRRASQEHEGHHRLHIRHLQSFKERAGRYWRKFTVISWLAAFFKQFHGSVTKSDYVVLRSGFINAHCPTNPNFDFHKYMLRTLEHDFRRIVGISWYLWVFVVAFLLLNISGWHTYFWLSFLPLILLLVVGTKLEHIISELAQDFAEGNTTTGSGGEAVIRPSDELFWFRSPKLVLYIIHFILFQNSFEIAFFVWIMYTYGARSCIMERLSFTIPRLVMGAVVQFLCSYSTFPLYALVTQMGSSFKEGMFNHMLHNTILQWAGKPASAHSITQPIESITISETLPNSSTIQLSH
ncbi:PREDICTED: MLO-like protein 13 isoform X2 [Ipomoea nil]|uniref:MLO-like protein 13 isoform X2 n=1 Tax=Ipomoea nil TaxID=35883 RepID=UPI000901062A|nr:PREDICTED: MLO-like protein 13 isoform X2 [Ipomoea nil]